MARESKDQIPELGLGIMNCIQIKLLAKYLYRENALHSNPPNDILFSEICTLLSEYFRHASRGVLLSSSIRQQGKQMFSHLIQSNHYSQYIYECD